MSACSSVKTKILLCGEGFLLKIKVLQQSVGCSGLIFFTMIFEIINFLLFSSQEVHQNHMSGSGAEADTEGQQEPSKPKAEKAEKVEKVQPKRDEAMAAQLMASEAFVSTFVQKSLGNVLVKGR